MTQKNLIVKGFSLYFNLHQLPNFGGNNLLIVGEYDKAITEIKSSLEENELSENLINKLAFKVLAWKYYKGLLFEIHK